MAGFDRPTATSRTLDTNATGTTPTGGLLGEGQLVGLTITNGAATVSYVKVYDKATAAAETDTPIYGPIAVTAKSTQIFGVPQGMIPYTLGLSVRGVTEFADNGTTGAATLLTHLHYQVTPQ